MTTDSQETETRIAEVRRDGAVARIQKLACPSWLQSFLRDDSGQATLEYILILSASVLGAAAISRSIISALDRGVLHLGAELEKDLRTGRLPVNVWKN